MIMLGIIPGGLSIFMSISIVVSTAACQTVRQLHVADVQLALGAIPIRLCRASAVVVSFAYGFAIIMGAMGRCRLVLGDSFAYFLTFATFSSLTACSFFRVCFILVFIVLICV